MLQFSSAVGKLTKKTSSSFVEGMILRSSEFLYKKCLLPCFKFWGIWKFRVESNWDAAGEREKKRGNAFACTQSVDIYLGLISQLIACYKWWKTIKQWRTRSKYHMSASALSKALSSMLCFLSCLVLTSIQCGRYYHLHIIYEEIGAWWSNLLKVVMVIRARERSRIQICALWSPCSFNYTALPPQLRKSVWGFTEIMQGYQQVFELHAPKAIKEINHLWGQLLFLHTHLGRI